MNNRQKQFFAVNASDVMQPLSACPERIREYLEGDPIPAPLTSPLQRAEYAYLVGSSVPVTFTIRVQLGELLTLGSDLSDHLAELVFNNEARPQVCDYRVVGASHGKFAETYSGYVHLQVSCLLNEF